MALKNGTSKNDKKLNLNYPDIVLTGSRFIWYQTTPAFLHSQTMQPGIIGLAININPSVIGLLFISNSHSSSSQNLPLRSQNSKLRTVVSSLRRQIFRPQNTYNQINIFIFRRQRLSAQNRERRSTGVSRSNKPSYNLQLVFHTCYEAV